MGYIIKKTEQFETHEKAIEFMKEHKDDEPVLSKGYQMPYAVTFVQGRYD